MARPSRQAVDGLASPYAEMKIDKVAGLEARGFILGGAVARQLGAGFVPLRKKGKLPHHRHSVEYALEYGDDCLEVHLDAVTRGRAGAADRRPDRHRRHRPGGRGPC